MQFYHDIRLLPVINGPGGRHDYIEYEGTKTSIGDRGKHSVFVEIRDNRYIKYRVIKTNVESAPRYNVRIVPRGYTYVCNSSRHLPYVATVGRWRERIAVEDGVAVYCTPASFDPIPMVYEDTGEEVVMTN